MFDIVDDEKVVVDDCDDCDDCDDDDRVVAVEVEVVVDQYKIKVSMNCHCKEFIFPFIDFAFSSNFNIRLVDSFHNLSRVVPGGAGAASESLLLEDDEDDVEVDDEKLQQGRGRRWILLRLLRFL